MESQVLNSQLGAWLDSLEDGQNSTHQTSDSQNSGDSPPEDPSLESTNTTSEQENQQTQATSEEEGDSKHGFKTFYCTNCGYEYKAKIHCSDRTCPKCAERKINRMLEGYLEFVKKEHEEAKANGEVGLKFLTLTLKNRDTLEDAHQDILKYFKKLRRREPYASRWKGGFYVFQITNKGNGWNIHMHVLIRGTFIKQSTISKDWHDITGDSYITWIGVVGKRYKFKDHDKDIRSPGKALRLILSYALRPPKHLSVSQVAHFNTHLKNRRVAQSFGSWHGQLKLQHEPFRCPNCGGTKWVTEYQLMLLHMNLEEFLELSKWCREQANSPPETENSKEGR